MIKIDLEKPVSSEGIEIKILELREPTGEDVVACGYPFRVYIGSDTDPDKKEQEARIDIAVVASLAARLAGVPKSTVKRLSISDFNSVTGAVLSFFG